MKVIKKSQKNLNKIIEFLNNGGVVVCPTDTVYGFLADATNKKAVEKIFKIKKRPRSKPLAVFVSNIKQAKELAEISVEQEKILTLRLRSGQAKYWPGKYTFILKQKPCEIGSHTKLYGIDKKTIALRIPKYKFLNDLLKKVNRPLAQTSVNISGQPVLTKISDIIKEFEKQKNQPDLIIDAGNLSKIKPSKIVDLTGKGEKVLRY